MTFPDYAHELANHIRSEGATSPAVITGLLLVTGAWARLPAADIDAELRWGQAATGALTVLDQLAPLPDHGIDVDARQLTDRAAALAAAHLLTAMAEAFDIAADPPSWYPQIAGDLRAAAAALA